MNLSQKAKKAVAAGLALSTMVWSVSLFAAPFAAAAPHNDGCLVNVSGTVYLVSGGQKRGFTSAEVFTSHGYNFGQVVTANSDDAALPTGPILIYADGTLVKGPSDPLVYLVVNGQKRGFTSGSVFTGLGYSFANIQWAPVNTFNDIPTGANIDSTAITGLPASGPGPKTVTCTVEDEGTTNTEGTMTVTRSVLPGNNSDVALGSSLAVLGFSVEAELSHLNLQRVDVTLDQTDGDDDLWDYIDSVSLYRGGSLLATKAVTRTEVQKDTHSEDTIRLDGFSSTISKDAKVDFEVRVAVTNDDDLNYPATFGVYVNQDIAGTATSAIRAVDGAGIQQIGGTASGRTFTIPDADAASLTVSVSDDNPETTAVAVDADSNGDEIELLKFDTEAEDGDVTITDMVVAVSLQDEGADDDSPGGDLSDYFTVVNLYADGTLVGTESAEGALADDGDAVVAVNINFDDIDFVVDSDETVKWTVAIEARAWDKDDAGTFEGLSVKANLPSTTTAIVAEDADGDAVVETGVSTTAGQYIFIYSVMPEITLVSGSLTKDSDASPNQANGTLTISVKAVGGDVYLDGATTGAAGSPFVFATTPDVGGDAGEFASAAYLIKKPTGSGVTETANTTWKITEGSTATFEVSVSIVAGSGGAAKFPVVYVSAVEWARTNIADPASTLPAAMLEDIEVQAGFTLITDAS